ITGKNIPQSRLTDVEMQVYRRLLEAYDNCENLKKRILEGRNDLGPSLDGDLKFKKALVRFTTHIPAIIGVDMKTYGPFEPEDVAILPRENAEALIRQGAAMKIET
ncbi:MAG: DNA replication complex subunit Gins51, partial [Candidatus Bathyarchaeia archaeon]